MIGFVAGAFSGLWVDTLYKLPYLNLRSFAHIVEELVKFTIILLLLNWSKLRSLLSTDRNSFVWFGIVAGLFFAFLENIGWILSLNIDPLVTVKRGFFSWPMHMLYTGCSAYGLVQVIIHGKRVYWLILLPVSMLLHFLFNTYISPIIS
jgi:hypothetical protein